MAQNKFCSDSVLGHIFRSITRAVAAIETIIKTGADASNARKESVLNAIPIGQYIGPQHVRQNHLGNNIIFHRYKNLQAPVSPDD